jgi:alpha-glucosidase (family GH31 glycosyl hydrolase)
MPALAPLLLSLACTSTPSDSAPVSYDRVWPEWTLKHWVWEDESTQESALALVDGYLARDIPVSAIIIDSPWETGYNTLDWDTERFPDPQAMIDELHAQDVHVFMWIVPAINTDVAVYDELAEKGWFMQSDADSGPRVVDWWKGEGSLIDFYNPEALDWWHGQLDKTLAYGIDGWKCDGVDYYQVFAPYSPGAGQDIARLDYSHTYYQDMHDYTRAQLGEDRVNTARPIDNYGFGLGGDEVAFAPRETLWAGWVGDQDADFGGLTAALENMFESAEYGYVAFGSDIGGYREDDAYPQGRSKEVLIRWAQLGAFTPVMENGGGGLHAPWEFDEDTVDIYRRFVQLHMALVPYLDAHGAVAFHEGGSLMEFTDEATYSYLLGPDVFVMPILSEGAVSASPQLPEGDWIYLFDGSQHSVSASVDVPLEHFPVFVRAGSEAQRALEDAL